MVYYLESSFSRAEASLAAGDAAGAATWLRRGLSVSPSNGLALLLVVELGRLPGVGRRPRVARWLRAVRVPDPTPVFRRLAWVSARAAGRGPVADALRRTMAWNPGSGAVWLDFARLVPAAGGSAPAPGWLHYGRVAGSGVGRIRHAVADWALRAGSPAVAIAEARAAVVQEPAVATG